VNFSLLLLQSEGGAGLYGFLIPLAIMFGIFYFLVIMPQRKQQQQLKNMIAELKSGDEVITNGGVVGKIIEVRDTSFFIRSADKSILEIAKTAVVGKRGEEEKKA
jgi:preprotein translocase subunit YajC